MWVYLPMNCKGVERATLRTYDDEKIEVLWLEPQKSTKGTK
jgi:hypothetical protein